MRELEAIEVTTTALEPNGEHSLTLGQPHPAPILLSHFEVTALSPATSSASLTDLRIDRRYYLLAPVPLLLVQQEHRNAEEHAARKTHQLLHELLGPVPPQLLRRLKPDRRALRLLTLDIWWKPGQLLTLTFKNAGQSTVDKITLELVLYAPDTPLPVTN